MRVLASFLIFCGISTYAFATEYKAGSTEITNPWSRVTPKGASRAVGYMTIKNSGSAPDRLVGGTAAVADSVQLHSMVMENGTAKMRELNDIEIKPGQTIEFKPGSSHAMFVGLKRSLHKGDRVSGTLKFEHAGTVSIEYNVEGIGARAPMPMDHLH
jgi:periplasmic copper chaperone A